MKYPEIYYPYFYVDIAQSRPEIKEPSEPKKPPVPLKPEKTEQRTGCLFVPVIMIFISFVISDYLDFAMIAGMIIISLLSIFLYNTGKWDRSSYLEKVKNYEREIRDYPKKLECYECEVLEYQEKLNQFYIDESNSLKKKNLKKYRNNLYDQFYIDEASEFEICNEEDDDIQTGISENFFYNYLIQIEGLTIYRYAKIEVGDTYYYPDFIAVVDSHEFYIDIEIDEPYDSANKKPIHFKLIDDYGDEMSKDLNRNEYFISSGWFVLRFAEEQIVRAPDECLEFIRKFVKKIKSFSLKEPKMEFEVDKWTEAEAEAFALEDFRLDYLTGIRKQRKNNYP